MHYLQFFKLNAEPFSQALASEYFYGSAEHSRVLDCLAYAAESRKGLALVTGPIGHGKSTLARRFLNSLPEDDYSAGMIVMVHGGVTAHWLLRHVATTLGIVNPVNEKLHLLSQIHERLLEIERLGKRAVVLVDEAQMLDSRELMEELRGLLNMESSRGKLVTLILFGLPEIVDHLALDPPLAQRVALRSNLGSLSLGEVEEYINHRMRIAGVAGKTFSMAVLREIYRWTTGVPRLINTLCDNVLLELFFRRERFPDPPLVAHVAIQLGLAGEMNQAQLVNDTITVPLPPASPPIESPGGDEEDKSATHELEEGLGFSPDEIASNVAQEVLAPFEEQEAFEMEAGEELIEIEDPKPQEDIPDPLDFLRLKDTKKKRLRTAILQDAIEISKMEVKPRENEARMNSSDDRSTVWDRGGSRSSEKFVPPRPTNSNALDPVVDTGRINSLIDEVTEPSAVED